MIRLVSLLDTHSGIFPDEVGFDFYCQQEWAVMADGVYVTAAEDPAHLGARILAIGDEPMDFALALLSPYMNSDNDSSRIWQLSWMSQVAQLLQAVGVITDITKPDIVLRQRDGSIVTVQLRPMRYGECGAIDLARTAPDVEIPMSASRRGEAVWWEVDPDNRAFVLAYNKPGAVTTSAIDDLKAALDAGEVDRVVVDLRYAPGGAYSPAVALVDALSAEARIDQPGRLAVVVGRESFSATNALISAFERRTQATFVGEPTPGRPNPFMNETTFVLPNSGLVVHIATGLALLADPDDHRDAIYPDIAVPLMSSDYFSGCDRALDVAMTLP
jgi:C-terminal processing protease CtpA/Prc